MAARAAGMNITILRPRMIVGPGRLGILVKLFRLIDRNLPLPMIGAGKNVYQMISVFDVVAAIEAAAQQGCPNLELNLGSDTPRPVRELLCSLIRSVGSRSVVVPTPGAVIKAALALLEAIGLPLMHREQYAIANLDYLVDITETKRALGWQPGTPTLICSRKPIANIAPDLRRRIREQLTDSPIVRVLAFVAR
jgi:dTDP-glucose 4,6-dehydratase